MGIPSSSSQPSKSSRAWLYHSTVRADLPSERLWTSKCRVSVLRSNLSWSMPRIRAVRPVTPVQLAWYLLASLGENCLVGKQWEMEPEDRIRQRIGKGFW